MDCQTYLYPYFPKSVALVFTRVYLDQIRDKTNTLSLSEFNLLLDLRPGHINLYTNVRLLVALIFVTSDGPGQTTTSGEKTGTGRTSRQTMEMEKKSSPMAITI